jgi:hypothetical protein
VNAKTTASPKLACIACGATLAPYFSKRFDALGLATVDYLRCPGCGFVESRTHAEMSTERWETLNHDYHAAYQGGDADPNDPRWLSRLQSQAEMLADATALGLLPRGQRWLDYACGDGKLASLVAERGLKLEKFDRYMGRGPSYLQEADLRPGTFGFVITTSVFEHLLRREEFDAIERLVSADGVLGLHTVVRDEVPADPSWFYLLPVHCSFHTNRSMSRLFEQWGYTCSVYHVESRLWLWFKGAVEPRAAIVAAANERATGPRYVFKRGFVDYWK